MIVTIVCSVMLLTSSHATKIQHVSFNFSLAQYRDLVQDLGLPLNTSKAQINQAACESIELLVQASQQD